jgi:hypothetical protein
MENPKPPSFEREEEISAFWWRERKKVWVWGSNKVSHFGPVLKQPYTAHRFYMPRLIE